MKQTVSTPSQSNNFGALATLIMVFFFWGFVAASNGIFVPFCKEYFQLSNSESQLVNSAFYGAYFIGSLLLFILSNISGFDILNRIGYKKGIVYGLLISVVGALLIIPSVNMNSFTAILASYFMIALGFSLQQTCAQPFAIALGPEETGSHRLSLAGGINSLGNMLGPIIVTFFLFGSDHTAESKASIENIKNLYIIVASVFTFVALVFTVSKLPDGKTDAKFEKANKAASLLITLTGLIAFIISIGFVADISKNYLFIATIVSVIGVIYYANSSAEKNPEGWGAMKYPQLALGMIGIFVYVGVEVTIDANFGSYLKTMGVPGSDIAKYTSLYWGSIMIGRWTGAIGVFNLSPFMRKIMMFVVPIIAFGIVLSVNIASGFDVSDLYGYIVCVVIAAIAFLYGGEKPVKTLLTLSLLATLSMIIGVFSTGVISIYAFIFGGLCCSIMWPSIFALAVTGLGKYTAQGSAFLIMMILGGAVIPPLQGSITDIVGAHNSYLVAAVCFGVLAFIALKMRSILAKQGVNV